MLRPTSLRAAIFRVPTLGKSFEADVENVAVMADGGARSSGSSLQGELEVKLTTRGQLSEKKIGFHKTVKLIFQ